MSDSNWRNLFKDRGGLIVSVLGACLLLVAVAWPAFLSHHETSGEASRKAEYYAADARNQIANECPVSAIKPGTDCSREINNAAREEQRREYDLAAQQNMALWTGVMGGMAVLGVALSAVGVYLIWRTWGATREAAENSRKTLNSYIFRERAVLRCTYAQFQLLDSEPLPAGFQVNVVNYGPSPGHIESVEWEYLHGPIWPKKLRYERFISTIVTNDNFQATPHLGWEGDEDDPVWLAIRINYTTLGTQSFQTHQAFKIAYDTSPRHSGYFAESMLRIADQPFDT